MIKQPEFQTLRALSAWNKCWTSLLCEPMSNVVCFVCSRFQKWIIRSREDDGWWTWLSGTNHVYNSTPWGGWRRQIKNRNTFGHLLANWGMARSCRATVDGQTFVWATYMGHMSSVSAMYHQESGQIMSNHVKYATWTFFLRTGWWNVSRNPYMYWERNQWFL